MKTIKIALFLLGISFCTQRAESIQFLTSLIKDDGDNTLSIQVGFYSPLECDCGSTNEELLDVLESGFVPVQNQVLSSLVHFSSGLLTNFTSSDFGFRFGFHSILGNNKYTIMFNKQSYESRIVMIDLNFGPFYNILKEDNYILSISTQLFAGIKYIDFESQSNYNDHYEGGFRYGVVPSVSMEYLFIDELGVAFESSLWIPLDTEGEDRKYTINSRTANSVVSTNDIGLRLHW